MNIVLKTERLILTPLGIKYLESTHKYASDIETNFSKNHFVTVQPMAELLLAKLY